MPINQQISNSITYDHIGANAMVDQSMQIVRAQIASATLLPRKIWETQFAMVSETLAFMARRMQAQSEFCAQLSGCKEIAEAINLQQDFARGVGGAYAEEAERLSTLTRKNMDTWAGVGAQYVSGWMGPQNTAA